MAFSGGLNERMEELRFPNVRSPNDEYPYSGYTSPPRGQNSFFSSFQTPSNDPRSSLQRRFTTDSSKIPGSTFGSQYSQMNSDYAAARELKNQQLEQIRAEKRKMEAQMKLLELQEEGLQGQGSTQDVNRLSGRLNRISLTAVSEPTTPPSEYNENGFSSQYSRTNRYSMNNITSPPGLGNRFSQSSSHITSPPSGNFSSNGTYHQTQKPPAKSMPGSRRNSDEEEYFPEELPANRSVASLNRFSMPVNSSRQPQRLSMGNSMQPNGLGPLNTTSFLFDDNDDKHLSLNGTNDLSSPIAKAFMQLGGDDMFPTLRSNGTSGILSANSAALDLANSRTPDLGSESWASGTKHRPSHQSMPQSELNLYRPVLGSPPSELPTEISARKPQRHSMGVTFSDSTKFESSLPTSTASMSRPTSLQSSYSTNDLPTVKTSNILTSNVTPPKTHAEQHLHNHNASMGRIPLGAVNNRQSRDLGARLSLTEPKTEEPSQSTLSNQSALQASAAPFGPQVSSATQPPSLVNAASPGSVAFNNGSQMYAYGMHSYNVNQMSAQMALNSQLQAYQNQSQGNFGQYGAYGQYGKDNLQRGPGRRLHNGDEARFNNIPLENYQGKLYELCKDQHGCRYLQRKLEDGNAEQTQAIFMETRPHIVELMTDPFGNYLCQKLFEHCTEEQRTALINTAAPNLVPIALNQHGTRALQKMIEYVDAPEQVQTIINSLSGRVVELVQDLNGNHVVQKCLNRLGAQNSEFIYDAVGKHCVIVGTHRHGCCVLQRCIDHSTGYQRAQLIARITENAFALVQDPFGNYVVQYILDLDEAQFTKPLCLSFSGSVPALSKQKFSSNVIEKCLRTADFETKRTMIDEMLVGNELEKMLRDCFANYVVQTAMDFADTETKMRIVENVRPILPAIKQTPHGRRIAGKIMSIDGQGRTSGTSSGQMTPNDNSHGTFPPSRSGSLGSGRRQVQILGGGFFGGANNSSRISGGYSGAGTLDTNFDSRNFGMNSAGSNVENTSTIFSPLNSTLNGSQNPYASYIGNQPGPGYF